MSTISVRSEAGGFALGNKRAGPASEGEKEPQFDAVLKRIAPKLSS